MRKRRAAMLLVALAFALATVLSVPGVALAATTADVTVTGSPTYIAISETQGTWTINGIDGDSKIDKSTDYYANPIGTDDTTAPSSTVVDGECYFTVTNDGNVAVDIAIIMIDFTGGDAWTNAESAGSCTPGAGAYCAWGYYSGATYPGDNVVCKTATGLEFISNLAHTSSNTKMWGIKFSSPTGDPTSGTAQTSTITLTATEYSA